MAIEIERKFLVCNTELEIPSKAAKREIKQAYLMTEQGKNLRVRCDNGSWNICYKEKIY